MRCRGAPSSWGATAIIRPTSATNAGPSSCGRASRGGSAMADDRVLLTVLLHHDQSKPLDEIMAHAKKTGFYRDFPPEGAEIVSWVVAVSDGVLMQLRVAPAGRR